MWHLHVVQYFSMHWESPVNRNLRWPDNVNFWSCQLSLSFILSALTPVPPPCINLACGGNSGLDLPNPIKNSRRAATEKFNNLSARFCIIMSSGLAVLVLDLGLGSD